MSISSTPALSILQTPQTAAKQLQAAEKQPADADKTLQALREFESIFVSLMVKQLRQSAGEEGLFPGDPSDSLGALFDLHIGQQIAEAGGIGITRQLTQIYAARQQAAADSLETSPPQ
jgi:Rod binding domain-containing protein